MAEEMGSKIGAAVVTVMLMIGGAIIALYVTQATNTSTIQSNSVAILTLIGEDSIRERDVSTSNMVIGKHGVSIQFNSDNIEVITKTLGDTRDIVMTLKDK